MRDLTSNASFVSRLQSFQRPVHREMSYRAASTFTAVTPTRRQALDDNDKTSTIDGWTPMSDRESTVVSPEPTPVVKPEPVLAPAFPALPTPRPLSTLTWACVSLFHSAKVTSRNVVRSFLTKFNAPKYVGVSPSPWDELSTRTPRPVLSSVRYTQWGCI